MSVVTYDATMYSTREQASLSVKCRRSHCDADPGQPCRDRNGVERYPHIGRLRDAGVARPRRRRRRRAKKKAVIA